MILIYTRKKWHSFYLLTPWWFTLRSERFVRMVRIFRPLGDIRSLLGCIFSTLQFRIKKQIQCEDLIVDPWCIDNVVATSIIELRVCGKLEQVVSSEIWPDKDVCFPRDGEMAMSVNSWILYSWLLSALCECKTYHLYVFLAIFLFFLSLSSCIVLHSCYSFFFSHCGDWRPCSS